MIRYVEVSHVVEAGMKTYPGLPEPRAEIFLDRRGGCPWGGSDSKTLVFVCHETETLTEGAEMHVRYENDIRPRYDLPRFQRSPRS